ncbi:MAG: HK97 gp10 family phage protein [Elusimicrobiota bacterium]
MQVNFNIKYDVRNEKVQNAVKNVLFKSMLKLHELSKKKCPVDTGRLRNSITLEPMIPKKNSYTLLAPVSYAGYVEFGTLNQKSQSFFRTSLREVERIHLKRILNSEFSK